MESPLSICPTINFEKWKADNLKKLLIYGKDLTSVVLSQRINLTYLELK
jgi:hypothetical protein